MSSADSNVPRAPDERTTVLEVFGVKLAVKNRRLAEILTMDAAEALGLDKRHADEDYMPAEQSQPDLLTEAVPDVHFPVTGAEEEAESRLRTQVRLRADTVASGLGFDVLPGGRWQPPAAPLIHTRILVRTPTPAAAAHMVAKLTEVVLSSAGSPASVLLIASDRAAVPPLLTAIDVRGLHTSFRIVTMSDLERLRDVCAGAPDPAAVAAAFLSPAGGVDVSLVLDTPWSE